MLEGEKSHSRLTDGTTIPNEFQWERLIGSINIKARRVEFDGVDTAKPHHRTLCLASSGFILDREDMSDNFKLILGTGNRTRATYEALVEDLPEIALKILWDGDSELVFVAMALQFKLQSKSPTGEIVKNSRMNVQGKELFAHDPYFKAIYSYIATGGWVEVAESSYLPLYARLRLALRQLDDEKLTLWLRKDMDNAIQNADIIGIYVAGTSDHMVDILANYVEKTMDYQTSTLIMSFAYPRYFEDIRCAAWRSSYKDFLQRHKKYLLRVKFEQQSTIKSRLRDGTSLIKPPPRQVTIRCLNCDANAANDLNNSGVGSTSGSLPSSVLTDQR